MIETMSWLALLIAFVISLPIVFFSIEASLGLVKTKSIRLAGIMPNTCVLVPAHNEAEIIADTLDHLTAILPPNTTALIIADNCSDNTADLVRLKGFNVLERHDADRRGKGYALAYGREHLATNPPECVIVFDADCRSDEISIAALSTACVYSNQTQQARYVFDKDTSLPPKVQISNFAFWMKNVVRQRGGQRLGGAAILTGTGMAFPWTVFRTLPLATGDIVEDLALAIALSRSGNSAAFFEQATVTSVAAHESATLEQRSRWEHGFLGVAKTQALPALLQGIFALKWSQAMLGLHLLVPPLAALFTFGIVGAIFLAGIGGLTGNWTPPLIVSASLFAAILVVLANWVMGGHQWVTGSSLLFVPFYVVWKLPLYGKFLIGKTASWVRTQRS